VNIIRNIKYRYITTFVITLLLASLFPYIWDDWKWGSEIGLQLLSSGFDGYDGRYLGNIIVIIMTRSNIVKSIIMAVCITGILWCIESLIKKEWAFYLSAALLVFIPRLIFRQAIAWTSGFANYVTSIFFTLLFIKYLQFILEDNSQKPTCQVAQCIPLLILGLMNTLIIEHITIYNVFLAVLVNVYVFVKYKTLLSTFICYFIGTLLGTILMFSNSAYSNIATNADAYNYRTMFSDGLFQQIFENYFSVIYSELCMNNIALNTVLLIICIGIYINLKTKINLKNMPMSISIWIMVAYYFFSVLSIDFAKQSELIYFEGIFTFINGISLIVFSLFTARYVGDMKKMIAIIGSILCLVAPLFVVTPIGSRCFFATYIFFIILVCELCSILINISYLEIIKNCIKKASISASIAGLIFYFILFVPIYQTDIERLEYIKQHVALGETKIEFLRFPNEEYIWLATPSATYWQNMYKMFNDLPEHIELQPVYVYSDK